MVENKVETEQFHLNGQKDPEGEDTETVEELQSAHKKLSNLAGVDGVLVSLTKQDLSLLKQMLHAPDSGDAFIRIVQTCDFLDEDERSKELDAFYEAVRLGMSTDYNIAHATSCASINRKGAHQNSRVAALLDALSHTKYTSNQPKGGTSGSSNPRSPLS
jgi:hypothetical protein